MTTAMNEIAEILKERKIKFTIHKRECVRTQLIVHLTKDYGLSIIPRFGLKGVYKDYADIVLINFIRNTNNFKIVSDEEIFKNPIFEDIKELVSEYQSVENMNKYLDGILASKWVKQ
jgi:hypothetical protein